MKNEENKYVEFFNDYFFTVNDLIKFCKIKLENNIIFVRRKIDNFISSTTPINYDYKKLKEQYEKLFFYENDAEFFNNLEQYGLFLNYIRNTHLYNYNCKPVGFFQSSDNDNMYILYANHKYLEYTFKINMLLSYLNNQNSNIDKKYTIEIIDKFGNDNSRKISYEYSKDNLDIPDCSLGMNDQVLFINCKKLINDIIEENFIYILEHFLPIFFDKYNGEIYVEDVINGNLQVY